MRPLGIALLLAAAQLLPTAVWAQAPRRDGTYQWAEGKSAIWSIDANHSLLWNGTRYAPVGIRVSGTPTEIDAANAAGIKDLLIDLPVSGDWGPAIDRAEANGQRYLIRLSSLAPAACGISVDPAAYRIAGLKGPKHIDLALPGVSEALVVVALKRDSSILGATTVKTVDGRLVYDTVVHNDLETVVLIYPRTDHLDIPDFWEALDDHRDAILARLKRSRLGAGFRGLVNPLGRTIELPGKEIHGVPTSRAFQNELASILEANYRNVQNAMSAWSLRASALSTSVSSGPTGKGVLTTTFLDLARLVPLWSDARGVNQLWDPEHGRIYSCDNKSIIWKDINDAVAQAAARRVQRLCASIRRVVDVPVIQEWSGWSGVTENREPAFDGVAARVSGDASSELVGSAARAVSTAARWSTPGWLVATDVDVPAKDLEASLNDLANLGLRAAFVQGPMKEIGLAAAARVANPPADFAIDPVFFPENAMNPAAVQRLPGGRWWLPTPQDGNRLDLGNQFFGYRMVTAQGNRIVLWTRTAGRYLLRVTKPESVTVTALDGSNPDPKKAKNGLTVTLSEVPVAIDCSPNDLPVPELAVKETIDEFSRLMQIADTTRHVGTDEAYSFSQAASNFESNPGGSFAGMREQLHRFAALLSPLSWIEAEKPFDSTFSESAAVAGASNGQALLLRSVLPPAEGFVANYRVPVTNKNEVELWVAARISPERRKDLDVSIGGQVLFANEAPVSAYGAGFAWYRLGTTRLTGGVTNVALRMRSEIGAEAAIDCIVFAPLGWRPNGVAYPYDVIR